MFRDFIPEMLHKMSQQHAGPADDDQFRAMLEGHDKVRTPNLRERTSRLFGDVLINSSTLRSVKPIRDRHQTMSLSMSSEPNSDICHSATLSHRPQSCSSSLVSEDLSDYYAPEKLKPVRKQRRVISLRKNSTNSEPEVKTPSLPASSKSSTPITSPFLDPAGSAASPNSLQKSLRSPSVSPALHPQRRHLHRPIRSNSPSSPARGITSPYHAGTSEELHIPSLEFENFANSRKHGVPDTSARSRRKSNVATPEQIFSSSSLYSIHSARANAMYSQHSSTRSSPRLKPASKSDEPQLSTHISPPNQHPTQFFLTTNPEKVSRSSTPSNSTTDNSESGKPSAPYYNLAPAEVPYELFTKAQVDRTYPPPLYR